jgi:hypothetical protein
VGSPVVGQKVPAVDEDRRNTRKPPAYCFNVADTPCQSADKAAFSAAVVEVAVDIADKIHNER